MRGLLSRFRRIKRTLQRIVRDPETGNSRQLLLSSTRGQMSVIQFSEPGEICGHGRITSNRCVTQKNARRRGMDSPTALSLLLCPPPVEDSPNAYHMARGPRCCSPCKSASQGRSEGQKTPIERQVEANIEHF